MSRFTKSKINWLEMEKLVPADQKTKFLAFKGKSDGYLQRVLANPAEPPKIDWAMYQKVVPIPGLVDKLKSQYESYKVPYPEDTLSKQVDAQWSSIEGEVKNFITERQKEIDEAKKELDRINALPKYEDMTMETFHDMYPKIALDPVKKPSFWPHNPEEQPGYKSKS